MSKYSYIGIAQNINQQANNYPTSDSEQFESILSHINLKDRNIIITGDFNLPTSDAYSYFEHILHSNSLKQLVTLPTRLNNILDLFMTNNPEIISELNIEEPHISDHKMVVARITVKRPDYKQTEISFRDFKRANFENLGSDICNIAVLPMSMSSSDMIQSVTVSLLELFDRHVPLISKTITEYPKKSLPIC